MGVLEILAPAIVPPKWAGAAKPFGRNVQDVLQRIDSVLKFHLRLKLRNADRQQLQPGQQQFEGSVTHCSTLYLNPPIPATPVELGRRTVTFNCA